MNYNKKLITLLLLTMMLVPVTQACHWKPQPEPEPTPEIVYNYNSGGPYVNFADAPMWWDGARWQVPVLVPFFFDSVSEDVSVTVTIYSSSAVKTRIVTVEKGDGCIAVYYPYNWDNVFIVVEGV